MEDYMIHSRWVFLRLPERPNYVAYISESGLDFDVHVIELKGAQTVG